MKCSLIRCLGIALMTALAICPAPLRAELEENWRKDYNAPEYSVTKDITYRQLASNVATLETGLPHGFAVGEAVTVAMNPPNGYFDGNYLITGVPAPEILTFARTAANQTTGVATAGSLVTMSSFGRVDRNRGMAFNPATGHLLLARQVPGIQILDAANGNQLGTMDVTGVTTGVIYLAKIRAISTGAIYGTNVATDIRNGSLAIYRWANEGAAPVCVYRNRASNYQVAADDPVGPELPSTAPDATVTNKVKTTNVATLTFSGAHSFIVGQNVTVALSPVDANFDGANTITGVGASTITYTRNGVNVATAASAGTVVDKSTRMGDAMTIAYDSVSGSVDIFIARQNTMRVTKLTCAADGAPVSAIAEIPMTGGTMSGTDYGYCLSPADNKIVHFNGGESAMYDIAAGAGVRRITLPDFMTSSWGSPPAYPNGVIIGGNWYIGFRDTCIVQPYVQYRARCGVVKVDLATSKTAVVGYSTTPDKAWANANGTGDADFDVAGGNVFLMNTNNSIGSYKLPLAGGVIKFTNAGGDFMWQNPANWAGGKCPTSADDVIIDNTTVAGSYDVILQTGTPTCKTLQVGYPGSVNHIRLINTSRGGGGTFPQYVQQVGQNINDLEVSGPAESGPFFSRTTDVIGAAFVVQIQTAGTPDTFRWNTNGAVTTWTSSSVAIVAGAWMELCNGIKIRFANSTGHIVSDRWEFRPQTSYMALAIAGNGNDAVPDFIIEQGGEFFNESQAVANSIINNLAPGNTTVVRNGGVITHGCIRSFLTPFPITGNGAITFEPGSTYAFDIYRQSGFAMSLGGRTVYNLAMHNSYSGVSQTTYTATNFTVLGNMTIDPYVNLANVTSANPMIFGGNLTNNGSSPVAFNCTGLGGVWFMGATIIGGSTQVTLPQAFTVFETDSLTIDQTIDVPSGKTVTTSGALTVNNGKTLNVLGTLDCAAPNAITGAGAVAISADATLKMTHPGGVNGQIATTGANTFSPSANYVYYGSTAQVTGTNLPAVISKTLTINNAANVTLSQNEAAKNLALTNGILQTGDMITPFMMTVGLNANEPGTITGTGQVMGALSRWIGESNFASPITYPMAGSDRTTVITLTDTGTTPAGTLMVGFMPGDPGGGPINLTDTDSEILRDVLKSGFWTIGAADGMPAAPYALSVNVSGFANLPGIMADARIVKRANEASPWTLDGTPGMNTTNEVKRNGMGGFSHFAIAVPYLTAVSDWSIY
ncbi:MAG: hypothetical protein WCK47_07150 [bacterium]